MKKLFAIVAACLLLGISAHAQSGSSSVRGIVTSQQSNPISGASVTLVKAIRKLTRSQVTNDDGAYSFKPVPPGNYRLEVENTGFKKSLIASVEARVDTPTDVNVQLEVGTVNETVNIASAGEAP